MSVATQFDFLEGRNCENFYFTTLYKAATGSEYDANKKPAGTASPAAPAATAASSGASGDLSLWEKVTAQGNTIRKMKSEKASKDDVMAAVNILKELKANYKSATGTEYD